MRILIAIVALSCGASCGLFGRAQQPRSYYTLAVDPLDKGQSSGLPGLVRVSNMDTTSTYDKFQVVVRESPYQLQYNDLNVWAVKPGRMVSDVIATALREAGAFDAVSRELGERRPDYTLAGDLNAIEVYSSGDTWFAHFAITLTFSRFSDGQLLWTYSFDQRKQVPAQQFATAIRGLSELLSTAIQEAISGLTLAMQNVEQPTPGGELARPRWPNTVPLPPMRERRDIDIATDGKPPTAKPPQTPVIVPETRPKP